MIWLRMLEKIDWHGMFVGLRRSLVLYYIRSHMLGVLLLMDILLLLQQCLGLLLFKVFKVRVNHHHAVLCFIV